MSSSAACSPRSLCDAADRAPADASAFARRTGAHLLKFSGEFEGWLARRASPKQRRGRGDGMDAEAEISRKEQLQRDTRACANLLRRLLRFHPDHAPTHMRKPADPAAAAPGSTGTGGTIAAIIRV